MLTAETARRIASGVLFGFLMAACDDVEPPAQADAEPSSTAAETPAAPAAVSPRMGDNGFETWTPIGSPVVNDAAATAPDGSMTADAIEAKINDGVGTQDYRPISPGETRTAKIYLWGTPDTRVVLQLVDWCAGKAQEVESKYVFLTETPEEYTVSHTYAGSYPCTRFQFILQSTEPTVINAWNARIE